MVYEVVPLRTTVGEVSVGGMPYARARQLVKKSASAAAAQGITVNAPQGARVLVGSIVVSTASTGAVASVSVQTALEDVRARQQATPLGLHWWKALQGALFPRNYVADVQINQDALALGLSEIFADQLSGKQAMPAQVMIQDGDSKRLIVSPGRAGLEVDAQSAAIHITTALQRLQLARIAVSPETVEPEGATAAEIEPWLPVLQPLIGDISFTFQGKSKLFSGQMVLSWLQFSSPEASGQRATLTISDAGIRQIAEGLDLTIGEPELGALTPDDITRPTRAKEFIAPGQSAEVDAVATAENLIAAMEAEGTSVALAAEVVSGEIVGGEIFGVREIIGVGHSNFKGSPKNRVHNITLGAASVHGTLVSPDEEFSLVKTLGPIDGAHGYLPELVIKKGGVIPEDGGGLCQVGTTLFRAALASGVPMTERHEHSYRVSYYEPAGTDCTIYDPRPDCKFKNDTGHYILITTAIAGNDLTFTFWGTKDGRTVEQTTPRIYNVTKARATKEIESATLKPGERKCSGHPVPGADAEFSTTVLYPDGQQRVDTFQSHYVPWGEVCLVGKTKDKKKN